VSAADMFGSVETEKTDEAPLVDLTTSTENPELVDGLAKVVDYISNKVADKVAQKMVSNSTVEQDGFDAVNNAVQSMAAQSGGKKKKKTRKFRLTKKNKTKGNKK
jgi:hypothetical protein